MNLNENNKTILINLFIKENKSILNMFKLK